MKLPRRGLLIAGGALGVVGVGGWQLASRALIHPEGAPGRRYRFANLKEARVVLDGLAARAETRLGGAWSWSQVLNHLAQGIEYSLVGYPQNRALLQKTVGRTIFETFQAQGYMKHDLAAPIPGAPELGIPAEPSRAYQRLVDAIGAFQAHSGPLAPHFVYGVLSRDEYDHVHAMHLAEHFGEARL